MIQNNKRQAYVQAAVTGGADEKVASLIACPRLCIDHERLRMIADQLTDIDEQPPVPALKCHCNTSSRHSNLTGNPTVQC